MKYPTSHQINTFVACIAMAFTIFLIGTLTLSARTLTVSYPIWYSTSPSVVTVDQKLGTMGAIYKGTAEVCEQFSADKKQCYGVTVK